jgi:hypothetical protein
MRHAWIQLEAAALARFQGAVAEFETPVQLPSAERPADMVLTTDDMQFIAECFCIYPDQDTRESMAYDREFGLRLNMIGLDVRLSGHYDVRLPGDETDQLFSEVELAAAGVRAYGAPRDVIRPGIEIHLAPWSEPGDPEITLEGPVTPGAEWRRARGIIHAKAQGWAGSPVPVWLRFDLLNGTWLFSDWAQRSLPDKTIWMAALITEAVAGTDVAGVVVSCGSRLDTASLDETVAAAGASVRWRRTCVAATAPNLSIACPAASMWSLIRCSLMGAVRSEGGSSAERSSSSTSFSSLDASRAQWAASEPCPKSKSTRITPETRSSQASSSASRKARRQRCRAGRRTASARRRKSSAAWSIRLRNSAARS